jgi:hypothetical protein
MTWLAWRQVRAGAAAAAAALAAVAVLAVSTGLHLTRLYDATVATCAAHGDCPAATAAFLRTDGALRAGLGVLVVVAPALVGIFWGAPLVAAEIEAGTFPLAWTQSVSRTRWLAVRLAVTGLAGVAAAGLLSLVVTWWASPLDRATLSQFGSFGQRDIVPAGYAAFAFALGVTAGVLVRRTVPAMAVTLAAFVTARLAFSSWIRPDLITPVIRDVALNPASTGYGWQGNVLSLLAGPPHSTLQPSPPDIPGAWIISTQIADRAGHALTTGVLRSDCPRIGQGGGPGGPHGHGPAPAAVVQAMRACVARVGATYHEVVTYQPASRYWSFQWYELAIFLGAALVLSGFCLRRVRRLVP